MASLLAVAGVQAAGLGQVTIVGINTSGSAATLSGALASLPAVPNLDLYYTSPTANLATGGSVAVNNGTFSATIPANCVFTLTGWSGLRVAITKPPSGSSFNAPATIPILATATTSTGGVAKVEFCTGSAESARAQCAVRIHVDQRSNGRLFTDGAGDGHGGQFGDFRGGQRSGRGPDSANWCLPDSAAVATGGTQQFAATARDVLGHALSPQPAFSWSVSGGGTMGSNGLFTAGGSVAAPFTIFATTGGFTGIAGVSVVSGGGGTLGNTNDGTASDTMWSGGAWINACRFQASSDLAASTVHAKVGAVPGRYKCGIYADSGGRPDAFFGGSADIANPADGWTVFTLTSPLLWPVASITGWRSGLMMPTPGSITRIPVARSSGASTTMAHGPTRW